MLLSGSRRRTRGCAILTRLERPMPASWEALAQLALGTMPYTALRRGGRFTAAAPRARRQTSRSRSR